MPRDRRHQAQMQEIQLLQTTAGTALAPVEPTLSQEAGKQSLTTTIQGLTL